ncbi:tau 95 subunit of transcription factor TFIIIC [Lambiella insularis]|nr:tau 95 subunit of transcription factor TFIIIC [Lambiella insularis]
MFPPSIFPSHESGSIGRPQPSITPWCSVPSNSIISVEHPFIFQDVPKALATLGGHRMVEKLVREEHTGREAFLSLHPHDRMSKPVASINVSTNNVLLRLTVPKRTGRKRKRGSTESYSNMNDMQEARSLFQDTANESSQYVSPRKIKSVKSLLRTLRDNVDKYTMRPMGLIEQTHRFRDLPDFVYSTSSNAFVQKVRDHILPFDYQKSKAFSFDMSKGPKSMTGLIPPPMFTHHTLPFNYAYRQNPSVKEMVDSSGRVVMANTATLKKVWTQRVAFDVKAVPYGPMDGIPPIETLDPQLQGIAQKLQDCMKDRPIWTRRALNNQYNTHMWKTMSRHVYQHVGYMFRSGPWREALVKYGVDPRTDPKYRIYQTMTFQFGSRGKEYTEKATRGGRRVRREYGSSGSIHGSTHIFDGANVSTDGKVWQVCDITDPLLQNVLATTDLRQECHIKVDGWYHNGTWAKARCITKLKMGKILSHQGQPNNADYWRLVALPDVYSQDTKHMFQSDRANTSPQEMEWVGQVRAMAGLPEGLVTAQDGGHEGTDVDTEHADARVTSSLQAYSHYEQEALGSEGELSIENGGDEEGPSSASEEDSGDEEDVDEGSGHDDELL